MNRTLAYLIFVSCVVIVFSFIFPSVSFTETSKITRESKSYQNYITGLIYDRLAEYALAKQAYKQALESDFQAWDIHYRLALDYIKLNDFKNAEREFNYVLKIKPYEERVRFLLALAYSYSSKYKEAVREYERLLARPLLELDDRDLRSSLGYLHILQGDFDRAQTQYTTILEDNPGDSDAHFYLGYIYHELSKYDIAIDEFVKAIELNPDNSAALNSLSYVYAQRGENLDEALSLVKKALAIEPSNGAYLDTLGWVYFKRGDFDSALRYLENASVLFRDAEIFEHLGDVNFKLGKFEDAIKNWRKAIEIDPKRKEIKDKIRQLKKKK